MINLDLMHRNSQVAAVVAVAVVDSVGFKDSVNKDLMTISSQEDLVVVEDSVNQIWSRRPGYMVTVF